MNQETKTYEGMFLVDAGNPDFQAASDPIRSILDRRVAEILAFKPWDERRLAFQVRGRKRGLYVLTYFKASPENIVEIERDCRLDERVLRVLVLRQDRLTPEQIQAETPATGSQRRAAEVAAARLAKQQEADAEKQTRQEEAPPPVEEAAEERPAEGAPEAEQDQTEPAAAEATAAQGSEPGEDQDPSLAGDAESQNSDDETETP
ncbi:MAG TPA: 30S ribosomal protein S6 [Phycisphaerae bacterium]|nr:30S ribosomal protein S6 [Phycisphaerae bacterium]